MNKYRKSNNNRIIFLWLYISVIIECVVAIIGENNFNIVNYSIYLFMNILVFFLNYRKIRFNYYCFVLCYNIYIALNLFFVNYHEYVLIESISSFIVFNIPLMVISSSNFKIEDFINSYGIAKKIGFFTLAIALYCYTSGLVNYGIFSKVVIPNTIFLSFSLFIRKNRSVRLSIFLLVNLLVAVLFSGRMAGFVCILIPIIGYILSFKNDFKKAIIMIVTVITGIFIISNYDVILVRVYKLVSNYNIHSRTLDLLIAQLSNGSIYMTSRDLIMKNIFEYVSDNPLIPRGFATVRFLTNGEFYHAHNLLLELYLLFGIFTLPILLILSFKIYKIINLLDFYNGRFLLLLYITFLIYSSTGTYFLTDPIGQLIFIITIFLYQGNNEVERYKFIKLQGSI